MTQTVILSRYKLKVGKAQLTYYCAGDGPAVVLIHGLSGSSRWWSRNIPALARHFRVYGVDLMGFGSSGGQAFSLAEAPEIVLDWMGRLGEKEYAVIGHSMGGYIAASIALAIPDQVKKLVLVDAVALPFGRSVFRSAWSLVESLQFMSVDFYPILGLDAMRAGPITLLRAIRDIHQQNKALAMSQISASTMVVWGENDRLVPLAWGKALSEKIPRAQFVLIRKAGHIPMWDQAGVFNQALVPFLLGSPGDPTG
jgi:pimeloyl-ACP methyl ester carboxylesterase